MLSKEENKINFLLWQGQSYLNLIPIEVELNDGTIRGQSSPWRFFLWKITYALEIVYFLYIALRFLQVIIHPQEFFVEHHFPCHFCCTFLFLLGIFRGYSLFLLHGDANVAVFNRIFKDQVAGNPRHWRQLSRQELFVIGHSLIVFSQWAGMMFLFILDGTQIQLLFSLLPQSYQNTVTFFTILLLDNVLLVGLFVLTGFAENVELLVFLKCEAACDEIGLRLEQSQSEVKLPSSFLLTALQELRTLTVMLRLFNTAHANIIFGSKLFCMTLSVTLSFFAIRLFHSNLFVGLIYIIFAAGVIIVFCITYENAGRLPGYIAELKKNIILLTSKIHASEGTKRIQVKMEARAIMNIGIKVGSFRFLERTSTPVFVDFVICQVAGLLVNFR